MVNVRVKQITIRTSVANKHPLQWIGVWFEEMESDSQKETAPNVFNMLSSPEQIGLVSFRGDYLQDALAEVGTRRNLKTILREYLNEWPCKLEDDVTNHWERAQRNSFIVDYLYDVMDGSNVDTVVPYFQNAFGGSCDDYYEFDITGECEQCIRDSVGDSTFVLVTTEERCQTLPKSDVFNKDWEDWDFTKLELPNRRNPMIVKSVMLCILNQ